MFALRNEFVMLRCIGVELWKVMEMDNIMWWQSPVQTQLCVYACVLLQACISVMDSRSGSFLTLYARSDERRTVKGQKLFNRFCLVLIAWIPPLIWCRLTHNIHSTMSCSVERCRP
jgi:hypothetical protein